ncbi:Glycerol kinase [hydrothermal vent metagenome]|uniref:glycerol kinase n=1 Tax=hydrothermal vent metagenome TaxID=652676 RepID=A0A3B1BLK8_9ZZZZ
MTHYLMAIDQGTTSSRAMIFDEQGELQVSCQKTFPQYFPNDGWVEHDGREIIQSVMDVVRQALSKMPDGAIPAAIGITNQRETSLIWDRNTGEPIYPAIVWQDRRTADLCRKMKEAGLEGRIAEKTGLLLDPYFSATKIKWILDNVEGARQRAQKGELAFGTVDSFILWHLTKGAVHYTDVTNASRTMLFNIRDLSWDEELLALFDVPAALLPQVKACDHHFGHTDESLFGHSIPITAMAGDQQAALMGHGCFDAGQIKATYGTGGFIMMNIGDKFVRSQNKLLTTVAYQIKGRVAYALEGSFFCAGSAVQWLRDGLKIIETAQETEALARSIDNSGGVYLVPAFTGLGAPHWNPDARGALFGLTRATGVAEIARATLESVGFQTADLLEAMQQDANLTCQSMKVDGGMVQNDWLRQFLANVTQVEVIRPQMSETTAFGIAMLAGNTARNITETLGNVNDVSTISSYYRVTRPNVNKNAMAQQKDSWKNAVKSTCYYSKK